MRYVEIIVLAMLAAAGRFALADKTAAPLTPAQLDLALEPPAVNVSPGPEYQDHARDFAMILGIERTSKGRLWAVWIAGGDSERGYVVAATSDDDGRRWSAPRLVIDPTDPQGLPPRRALVGNFWTDPTGRLWLFFDQSIGYYDGRSGVWAITCDNPDDARPTWSAPRRIWHGATLNKPIVLAGGQWLLPISLWQRSKISPAVLREAHRELDDQRMAHWFVSTDQGASWTRRGGVRIPNHDFDEHTLVERRDGSLWMLARSTQGLYESVSTDRGRTWSDPRPSPIQTVNARVFLRRLQSGRVLLVKHGAQIDHRPRGRSHLSAFLSDDDGRTWQGGLVLDERGGVSYPDGFQSPDGSITMAYDHNRAQDREILRARFTEADVLAQRFLSPQARPRQLINKATGPAHSAKNAPLGARLQPVARQSGLHIDGYFVWCGALIKVDGGQ